MLPYFPGAPVFATIDYRVGVYMPAGEYFTDGVDRVLPMDRHACSAEQAYRPCRFQIIHFYFS